MWLILISSLTHSYHGVRVNHLSKHRAQDYYWPILGLPYIRGFFSLVTKFVKMVKICIINLRQSIFAIKKFLIKIDTGYNFCVFTYLRLKRKHEKAKITSSRKLADILYFCVEPWVSETHKLFLRNQHALYIYLNSAINFFLCVKRVRTENVNPITGNNSKYNA